MPRGCAFTGRKTTSGRTYTHRGKVDAIYIDPPYNTGARDWKYNNDYVEGDDLYRHSKWLAFMERRLEDHRQDQADVQAEPPHRHRGRRWRRDPREGVGQSDPHGPGRPPAQAEVRLHGEAASRRLSVGRRA